MEEGENQPEQMLQEVTTFDQSTIESLQEGETITLSLEEASQLLMYRDFAPGTYQILTTDAQNMAEAGGQIPFEVINGDEETLVSFLPEQATQQVEHNISDSGQQMMIQIKTEEVTKEIQDDVNDNAKEENTTEDVQTSHTEKGAQELTVGTTEGTQNTATESTTDGGPVLGEESADKESENIESSDNKGGNQIDSNQSTESSIDQSQNLQLVTTETDVSQQSTGSEEGTGERERAETEETPATEEKTQAKPQPVNVKTEPKPDLASPISVSDRTEVVINGKKCVLLVNPDTKEMCAYPLLPPEGKKRRGRPKKEPKTAEELAAEAEEKKKSKKESSSGKVDQANSAVEGLLELSNTGPDGVRRSNRPRKKTKTLEEYESLVLSGDEDDDEGDAGAIEDDDDEEVVIPGYKKRKLPESGFQGTFPNAGTSVKRPRGRPRRYPPAGHTTSSIPAVLIPSSNGQTLVMAPLQGVQNVQSLQQQVKSLPNIMPRVTSASDTQLTPVTSTSQPVIPATETEMTDAITNLQMDPATVLDSGSMLSLEGDNLPALSSDTSNLDLPDEKPTIIQIPENLLPMFMPKKDPVKIGLKASESELEKLKCPKCDFQAYYPQQFQEHIGTHSDAIHKCKCCNFNSFDREELLTHFKESHPRCICKVCDFMAEHAYVIKRHMVRHNNMGCTCNICGRVYKDQYILKMHVKMVHMPAEVLFECNICLKKFTRKAHLKRHLRIHDPEKPFKCPHCDYRGCERSDISKHLLIHEAPKHVCEVCGKAFRHIKNKELHVKRHNGQKDYKCGVCGFYGYTFTDIRKHIERKHGDMKSLVCDRCGMAFKAEALLRAHQKSSCGGVIEQALAIATSDGGTSQAMIQIPSTLSVDGQHITIDGQEIAVDADGAVNITFEQVLAADDEGIQLLEDQMGEEPMQIADGQVVTVTEADGTIENQNTAILSEGHEVDVQGQEIIGEEHDQMVLDIDSQSSVEQMMANG